MNKWLYSCLLAPTKLRNVDPLYGFLPSPILSLQGSLGHHGWLHNQFPPFFSVLHCPLGLGELQACPFSVVVFPPLFLSALSSAHFHCALQDGFGQTWWVGNMSIPLQFVPLYDSQAGSWHRLPGWYCGLCKRRIVTCGSTSVSFSEQQLESNRNVYSHPPSLTYLWKGSWQMP